MFFSDTTPKPLFHKSVLLVLVIFVLAQSVLSQYAWQCINQTAPFSVRAQHQTVSFKDHIWLISGFAIRSEIRHDLWKSTDGVQWHQLLDSLPFDMRLGFSIIPYNNRLWICGGWNGL